MGVPGGPEFAQPPEPKTPSVDDGALDKRGACRQRALLAGKIVFDHGARSLDCTIRNLSEQGAQLRLASMELLPEVFHLIELRRGLAHEARIAWTRTPQIGVHFLSSVPLETADAPEFKRLRQIWLEHLAR